MTREYWNTSVTECIHLFKNALSVLIPILREARIPIGTLEGSNGWDDISELLFYELVVEPIKWTLPEPEMEDFKLPVYEATFDSYVGMSYIQVIPQAPMQDDLKHIFHSFKSPDENSSDLEEVYCVLVNEIGECASSEMVILPIEEVKFVCVYKKEGAEQTLDNLRVP